MSIARCRVSTKRVWLEGTWAIAAMRACKSQPWPSTASGTSKRMLRSAPEIIEVEPVVGREAAIVLDARGVALDPRLQLRSAVPAADIERIGKGLPMDGIAPPAEVKPEEEHHRCFQDRREEERPLREVGRRAEEVAA